MLALAALAILGLCVAVVVGQVQSLQLQARHDRRSTVLGTLSDAAFAETLALLSLDVDAVGVAERAFGGGTIASGILPMGEHRRRVVASAAYRGWTATIDAEVDVTSGPVIVRLRRSQALDRGDR